MKITFDRVENIEWMKTFVIDLDKPEVKDKFASFLEIGGNSNFDSDSEEITMEQYLAMDKSEREEILQNFAYWIINDEEDENCFDIIRDECIDCHATEDGDIELLDS